MTRYCSTVLDKQVFNSQSAISVVAACVAFLRRQAERLLSQGLDLLFMLDARLQASVEKVYTEWLLIQDGQMPTGWVWLVMVGLLCQGLDLLFMLDARLQASVEKVHSKRWSETH